MSKKSTADILCPACGKYFSKFLVLKVVRGDKEVKQKHCPECRVPLHECNGRNLKGIYLQEEADSASRIVSLLEEHISRKNDIIFEFNPAERASQLVHAYAYIERAKIFLSKQNSYGVTPYELAEEATLRCLKADVWKITNDLLLIRNRIAGIAQEVFKEKRQAARAKSNAAATYTDISPYLTYESQ